MQNRRLPHPSRCQKLEKFKKKFKKETCDTILLHCCIIVICISDAIIVAYIYTNIYYLYMQKQNNLKFKNDY